MTTRVLLLLMMLNSAFAFAQNEYKDLKDFPYKISVEEGKPFRLVTNEGNVAELWKTRTFGYTSRTALVVEQSNCVESLKPTMCSISMSTVSDKFVWKWIEHSDKSKIGTQVEAKSRYNDGFSTVSAEKNWQIEDRKRLPELHPLIPGFDILCDNFDFLPQNLKQSPNFEIESWLNETTGSNTEKQTQETRFTTATSRLNVVNELPNRLRVTDYRSIFARPQNYNYYTSRPQILEFSQDLKVSWVFTGQNFENGGGHCMTTLRPPGRQEYSSSNYNLSNRPSTDLLPTPGPYIYHADDVSLQILRANQFRNYRVDWKDEYYLLLFELGSGYSTSSYGSSISVSSRPLELK